MVYLPGELVPFELTEVDRLGLRLLGVFIQKGVNSNFVPARALFILQ